MFFVCSLLSPLPPPASILEALHGFTWCDTRYIYLSGCLDLFDSLDLSAREIGEADMVILESSRLD